MDFEKNITTAQAITAIISVIQCASDTKTKAVLTFVDIIEAFDMILIELIMKTVNEMNLHKNMKKRGETKKISI